MLNKQGTTISLCMIVRDEQNTIGRCLDAVEKIVDEIIVVDTGSIDRTKEIVARYTSNIHNFPWIDDFAATRNFSFSKATQE
ncbi:glycosyltransferase [Bacillus sp. SH5-2]|uniref:glycosyltransferase n=1 Tax=Bacillus sp. SH5-2 TaxID=2217834 RepID=UPI00351A01C2